jgi:hypothetical protein
MAARTRQRPLPLAVVLFFEEMETGVDYGAAFVVRWLSKNGRYVIYTRPGHKSWAGIGMQWEYKPSEHYVADLRKSGDLVGLDLRLGTTISKFGGRLNIPETLKKLKIKEAV